MLNKKKTFSHLFIEIFKGMIETAIKGKSKELEPLAVDFVLKILNTKLFETKTAGELINGYKDPLMTLAKIFLPKIIKDDKFSLINGVTILVYN